MDFQQVAPDKPFLKREQNLYFSTFFKGIAEANGLVRCFNNE